MEFVLLQMIPTASPLLAVFAKEDGTPQFDPVVCLATVEFYDGPQDKRTTPARAIVGYTASKGPLAPADTFINFCGYEPEFAAPADRPLAVVDGRAQQGVADRAADHVELHRAESSTALRAASGGR